MVQRRLPRLAIPLALLGAVAVSQPSHAQNGDDFRAKSVAEVTKWLETNVPAAAQLKYLRFEEDDDGVHRIEGSLAVTSMKFAGCSMDYRERLAINDNPAEVRRWSANLAELSREVSVSEVPPPDGQQSPMRWWMVVIRDADGRGRLRAVQEGGKANRTQATFVTLQIPDEGMAGRVARAFSAAVEVCRRRS